MAVEAAERQGGANATVVVLGGDAIWPIAPLLRFAGVTVLDSEPPPKQIEPALAERYGFSAASVRAGTLGDPRLLLQHLRSAVDDTTPGHLVWTDGDGLFRDATRAMIEPGADSANEVVANHKAHLAALRKVVGQADLLVLPLRGTSVVEDGKGSFFPAPLKGMKPPRGCKTKASPTDADGLKAAFGSFLQLLHELRPGCRVRLLCPDQGEEVRSLATALAKESDGVLYHPLIDELLLRLQGSDRDPKLGVLLAKVLHAADVVGVLAETVMAASGAEPSKADSPQGGDLGKAEKRARKAARARRKAEESSGAQVVCEDELLEAFS